jgi:hypothetical protein
MDFCFVTSFYDIGRSNWKYFERTPDDYLSQFSLLCQMRIPLVVFIDKKYYEILKSVCNDNRPSDVLTKIVPIDEDFLKNNIQSWNYIDTERKIMESESYKKAIDHRKKCPETHHPEYTCINHAKIDFIKFAIDNIVTNDVKYLGWVDFGYIRKTNDMPPDRTFVYEKLKNDNVNMISLNDITENDKFPEYVLVFDPERVIGGFWFGLKESLIKYWKKYHETVQMFHSINIADDDQAVITNIFANQTDDLIKTWKNTLMSSHGWFGGFLLFS